ncbi:MAG: hypothetical protein FWD65_07575 [Coriobacteriia bacterium]|nr:hypothetical protein [Coriobacteriia bacterium]
MRSRYFTIIITGALCALLCLPAASAGATPPARGATGATPGATAGQSAASASAPAPAPASAQEPAPAPAPKTTIATLDADQASVTATGTFSYTVRIRPAEGADSISARLELFDLQGKNIFLRSKYWNFATNTNTNTNTTATAITRGPAPTDRPDASGAYSYTFSQDVSSLALPPGDYAVKCTVKTSSPERIYTQQFASHLFVYDPAGAPAPATVVLRIGAPALQRTSGVYASDPTTGTARLRADEISRLSRWILTHPMSQLTLAPSPLLIKELADIADGCQYVNSSGSVVELSAESPSASAIAQSLDSLREALATGRLQLAWQGYSDPDVGALLRYQLTADVTAQYRQGATTLNTILDAKPAPITAPFGDKSVMDAQKLLAPLGVTQVLPAGYNTVSQSLETSTVVAAQANLFTQRGKTRATVAVVGLPVNQSAATALLDRIEALQGCAWIKFQAPDAGAAQSVTDHPGTSQQPFETERPDFAVVYKARVAARGLTGAVDAKDQSAKSATQLSLIAENAFGPYPDGGAASGAESYTQGTLRIVKKAFAPLSLKTRPVTLAGNSGEAPITVASSSATQMQVHLEFSGRDNRMKVEPSRSPTLTVEGAEVLFSPKVTLYTVSSSNLKVRLMAGEYAICEDSVAISGSYLDIIGIVVIVVMVGAVLVFYIWRHAKKEQEGGARAR